MNGASKASSASKADAESFNLKGDLVQTHQVLIITYYWPPSGGAGVQRWLKFSKYLPGLGLDPIILTVDPDYAEYPALDESLLDEQGPEMKVFRTKAANYFRYLRKTKKNKTTGRRLSANKQTSLFSRISMFIRGNFFIPDPRKGWNRYALKKALEIVEKEKIDYIITTSPPHSTQLIGLKIKEAHPDIKWIADFRDPWTRIYYYNNFHPSKISRKIDSRLESSVLKKSDIIFCVGNKLKEQFVKIEPSVSEKISVIYNGYDNDDFEDSDNKAEPESVITYVGTLSDQYPIETFIKVVKEIEIKNNIPVKFRIVGDISEKWAAVLQNNLGSNFQHLPYTRHKASVSYMNNSRILLLVIPQHDDNRVIITGKLFEYLRTGRPILNLGPDDGEAAEIISACQAGITVDYCDREKMLDYIRRAIASPPVYKYPGEYSRKAITKHVAESIGI